METGSNPDVISPAFIFFFAEKTRLLMERMVMLMLIKSGKFVCFLAMFVVWKFIFFIGRIAIQIECLIWDLTHRQEFASMWSVGASGFPVLDKNEYEKIVFSMPTNQILRKWHGRTVRTAEWAGFTVETR